MFRVSLQHNSGRATALDGVPCRQSSKHFISGQLKVIPLFRYSVFCVLQRPPAASLRREYRNGIDFFHSILRTEVVFYHVIS